MLKSMSAEVNLHVFRMSAGVCPQRIAYSTVIHATD